MALVRISRIELSVKVVDSAEKLAATLLHEMCHAAAWVIDGVSKPPHGAVFWKWGRWLRCGDERQVPVDARVAAHCRQPAATPAMQVLWLPAAIQTCEVRGVPSRAAAMRGGDVSWPLEHVHALDRCSRVVASPPQ